MSLKLIAPSLSDIEALAEAALAELPPELATHTANLLIQVEELPDEEVCEAMDLDSPFDLLGLYRGVSLLEKSSMDTAPQPDMVHLYRRPILDYWCESGDDLNTVVRHVLIHEIGHHFGFSDADMEALEEAAQDE